MKAMAYQNRFALDLVVDAVAVVDGCHLPAAVEVGSEIIDRVADGYDRRAVVGGLAEVGITVVW